MASAQDVGLTPQQAGQAQAALARLQGQGPVDGRFRQVKRAAAQENADFTVYVHVHDGPEGNGRTITVELIRNNVQIRRTVGEGAHGVSSDGWQAIDLTKLLGP